MIVVRCNSINKRTITKKGEKKTNNLKKAVDLLTYFQCVCEKEKFTDKWRDI